MSDNTFAPGWYEDPMGRGEQRYYDGTAWTDQIRIGGVDQTDALNGGTTHDFDGSVDETVQATIIMNKPSAASNPATNAAFGAPTAAAAAPAAGQDGHAGQDGNGSSSLNGFLDTIGDHARTREKPEFPLALGGVGGALVGSGIMGLIGQSASRGAILGGAAVAFAIALATALKLLGDQPWLRTAATACGSVALFGIAGGLILAGEPGENAAGLFLLLTGALHLAAWVAPGFRGRPLMLGGGLFAASFGIALLAAGGYCDDFGCNQFEDAFSQVGLSSGAGIVMIVIGAGLLFAVRKLDGDGYLGVAGTVAAAAIVTLIFGAAALSVDLGQTGNSVFVLVVGLALGIVGHMGERRALTWTGAALAAGGVISLIVNTVNTNDATVAAIVVIVTGTVLIGAPRFIQMQAANNSNTAN